MNSNRLLRHYTSKYSGELNQTEIPDIPRTAYPTNRYDAAVHFLGERFKGEQFSSLALVTGLS